MKSIAHSDVEELKAAKKRLYPSLLNDRYYLLTQYRKCLQVLIDSQSLVESATIVDFGCGEMPYRSLFPDSCHYIGADIASNSNANTLVSEKGTVELPDASADLVLSLQVLEHVADTKSYLAECHRLLKPQGALILTTHGHWMYHPHPTDFWRWTADGLDLTLSNSGFDVVHISGVLSLAATGANLFQDGWMPRLPRVMKMPFGLFMQSVIALSDWLAPSAAGPTDCATLLTLSKRV